MAQRTKHPSMSITATTARAKLEGSLTLEGTDHRCLRQGMGVDAVAPGHRNRLEVYHEELSLGDPPAPGRGGQGGGRHFSAPGRSGSRKRVMARAMMRSSL